MAASSDAWRISGDDRSKHDAQFFQLKPVNGFVTGNQARDFFMQSGLTTPVLGQIWTLADMNGDGKMDKKEFSIAMHLIKKKLQGYELPKVLPASLKVDPTPVIGTFAQPAMPGVMQQQMGMNFPIGGGMNMPGAPLMQPQASLGTSTMTTGSLGMGPRMANGTAAGMQQIPGSVGANLPPQGTMPGQAMPGSAGLPVGGSIWALPHNTKLKYTQTFNANDRNKRGYLLGVEARALLMQSGLPQQMLAQIWTLADTDRDGKLTCDEFCIAMHLSELARVGHALPPTLPPELLPTKARSGSLTSPPSTNVPVGPPKNDAFGDLLTGSGMPQVMPPIPGALPAAEDTAAFDEQVTFEDKRKENFDKGQAELERRRAVLREQQKKEENARLEKDRQEAEKRERQRLEVESKRQADLQRQLEKHREKEREVEEQRRKLLEQREAARRELDRQRQMEWERQRKEQLLAEKQREYEQLSILKSRMANLKNELESLDAKKTELSMKVNHVQSGVTDFTTSIDAMRVSRDRTLADIDLYERQTEELNKKVKSLGGEKDVLNIQVQSGQATPMSDAHSTIVHSVETKRTSIQRLKKEVEQLESDTEAKLGEIDCNNAELKNLKSQLTQLEKDLPRLQRQHEERLALQKKATKEIQQKQERQDRLKQEAEQQQKKKSTSAPVPPPASNSETNWFDFKSTDAATSSTGNSSVSTSNWENVFADSSSTAGFGTSVNWGSNGSTGNAAFPDSSSKIKCRALYDFTGTREDELSLSVGTEVWVFQNSESVSGMEDWHKGECNGNVGWFPKSYVERIEEKSTDLFESAFKPVVQSSAPEGAQYSSSHIPPEGLLAKATYPWKARQESDLTFDKDDVILVKQQEDMKWFGELNGKSGWFPKAYVKLIGVAPKSEPAVGSVPTSQVTVSEESNFSLSLDQQGEYYIAMYTYTSDEPADLVFNEGDMIFVTASSGDWWTGSLGEQGKSGIFPANYVKKLDIQPGKTGVSSDNLDAMFTDHSIPGMVGSHPVSTSSDGTGSLLSQFAVSHSDSTTPSSDLFSYFEGHGNAQVSLSNMETRLTESTSTTTSFDTLSMSTKLTQMSDVFSSQTSYSSQPDDSTSKSMLINTGLTKGSSSPFLAAGSFDLFSGPLESGQVEKVNSGLTSSGLTVTDSISKLPEMSGVDPFGDVNLFSNDQTGIYNTAGESLGQATTADPFSGMDPFADIKSVSSDMIGPISSAATIGGELNPSCISTSSGPAVSTSQVSGVISGFEKGGETGLAFTSPSVSTGNKYNLDPQIFASLEVNEKPLAPSANSLSSNLFAAAGGETNLNPKIVEPSTGFDGFDDIITTKESGTEQFSDPRMLDLTINTSQSASLTLSSSMPIKPAENEGAVQMNTGLSGGLLVNADTVTDSGVTQTNLDLSRESSGSGRTSAPVASPGFKPEQKSTKKPEIARVIAPYVATGTGQLSLETGNLINVRQKSPRGWWEGELQVRGQKKKIGWFPANYVKLLGSSSARSTPEPSATLSVGHQGSRSATPQSIASQDGVAGINQLETVVALYAYTAQNDDELTFQKDAVITVLSRDNPDWWNGQLGAQTGVFPSNYVTPNPQSQSWMNDTVQEALTKQERKRQQAIQELINTEESYNTDMQVSLEVFKQPMIENNVLPPEQIARIFVNWEELIVCNKKLLQALRVRKKMCGKNGVIFIIGDILCESFPHMHAYVRFCSCQLSAAACLQRAAESIPSFQEFHKLAMHNPKVKGVHLSGYLLKPMQRITRYPLLIEKILANTPSEHADRNNLEEALTLAQELCSQANQCVKEKQNSDSLEWIQAHVHCDGLAENIIFNSLTNCLGPRRLLFHGLIYKAKSNKELLGFLFNDFLLLATPSRPLGPNFSPIHIFEVNVQFKMYQNPIFLNEVTVKKGGDDAEPTLFQVTSDRIINLKAVSFIERDAWIREIEAASKQYKDRAKRKLERAHSVMRAKPVGRVLVVVEEGVGLRPALDAVKRPSVGRILVVIQEAHHLKASDALGKSDPYCEVSMGSQEHRTKVVPGSLNPRWNASMQFLIRDVDRDTLCFTVYDRDLYSPNDFLGRTEVRIKAVLDESGERRGPITKRLILHEVETGEVIVKLDLQLYES